MYKIIDSFSIRDLTVLVLDNPPPFEWKGGIRIENIDYEMVMVYDIPNAIGIRGTGNFTGKTVELF